ncbi:MAG: ABC transporter permease [Polyangiaceae bacterium]|nr:ABC transporter permease [Polyangiaceae bacterium]
MRGSFVIFKRELFSFWTTPLAWVLLTVFLGLQGGIFTSIVVHTIQQGSASPFGPLSAYFGQQSILLTISLLLLCPALTMRSFAEERKTLSIDLLLAAPIRSSSIVLGKYLAALATYLLIWLPTVLYALILRPTGTIDLGALLTSYFGLLLIGMSSLALGTLLSALAKSQLVALLLTIGVQFGLFVLGLGEYLLPDGPFRDLCAHLSLASMLEEISRGLLDSRRVIFHLSLTLWATYITTEMVESWRSSS